MSPFITRMWSFNTMVDGARGCNGDTGVHRSSRYCVLIRRSQ